MYCNLGLDLYLNNHRDYSRLSFLRNYSCRTIKVTLKYSCYNIYNIRPSSNTHFSLHFMVFFLSVKWIHLGHLYKSSVEKCLYLSSWTNVLHPFHCHESTNWLLIYSLCLHVWFIKEQNYMNGYINYYIIFYSE